MASDRLHEGDSGFTAMVLAGGLGTRLRPALGDRPKALAPVDGEPFLLHVLDQLAAAGCRRAILCTGHLAEAIEREFGGDHDGMELVHSREPRPLGTAGALRRALPRLGEPGVLVVNGDSYVDLDLRQFVAWARTQPNVPALVAVTVPDAGRYGAVQCDADDRVTAFGEKSARGPGAINAGVYWLPARVLALLPPDTPCSLEREVLPVLVGSGLRAFRCEAPFLDIGVPEAWAAAGAFFAACARRRTRAPSAGLLVVDRDGTLIDERHYLADPAGVQLLPGVVDGLRAFAANGYRIAVVTNQSGIGRGYFDEAALQAVHAELCRQLAAHGVVLDGIWHCPHRPDEGCRCRKPNPQLLEHALGELGVPRERCLVVGDKACDIDLGTRLGVRTALVRTGYGTGTERDGLCAPDVVVDSLFELAQREVLA
ncbi:MAG: HAD-IIIA family hydrolase [Planctomycetes bacterium]|nr:HAD-IIIA family hydrolase [Planctomycetota bacterium]